MPAHIDPNGPQYITAASEILRRHDRNEPEANITSGVRDFLIVTGLARSEEIMEENPPSPDGSRRAVDLTALDTFVEVKRRIGTTGGFEPDPRWVEQIDDYLSESARTDKGVRTGILTDGRYWLLRWPGAGAVRTSRPYAFVLDDANDWLPLFEWLRDEALVSLDGIPADRHNIERHLGPSSPSYERDVAVLKRMFDDASGFDTIRIKRQLWFDLLRSALGEIATSETQLDDLFVRHTYLSMVIGMVVQASFGLDLRLIAEREPSDLLRGRTFWNDTGLQGVVESDFFAWPTEVGGDAAIRALARRIARFDWRDAPSDVASILYETVIPPAERRTLGEYYTPDWLARAMVSELVDEPLEQRALDPACGSGTFVAESVRHFIRAADRAKLTPKETLDRLTTAVTGIDVHPVAVHLARSAWVLAARPAIEAAVEAGYSASVPVPIYLGDALQLRFRTGDMFAEHNVTIQVHDDQNTELVFPVSLVERPNEFDTLMNHVADAIESGEDPVFALDDSGITDPRERATLGATIGKLARLHGDGRDHIWAYYTRNLVRPVALARGKVDVVIGNPPWLNYNQTANILRDELRRQSRDVYGIWAGGRYATHQDVAGLFFTRCVDLYLKDGGAIGMVMPHSALQTGQYSKWRTGRWSASGSARTIAVDFDFKTPWDLEGLTPNTFFPVPACVVFAEWVGASSEAKGHPLKGHAERWLGNAGSPNVRRVPVAITDTSAEGQSPYAGYARQGATIVPRRLFFVEETESAAIIRAGQTIMVNPRRGGQDKAPWKNMDLTDITGQTIETQHVFDVHLGETVVPYATLDPLKAVLPITSSDTELPKDPGGVGGIDIRGLGRRMRSRWRTVSEMWETNKARANKLDVSERLDYYGNLSAQLEWRQNPGDSPIRVVHNQAGAPTAAILPDDRSLVDYRLYWITCQILQEAHYLLAIINSDRLYESVLPLMPKGQFGARDLMKHLWKLPIPEFDPNDDLHKKISEAGSTAAEGAAQQLEKAETGTRSRDGHNRAPRTARVAEVVHRGPGGRGGGVGVAVGIERHARNQNNHRTNMAAQSDVARGAYHSLHRYPDHSRADCGGRSVCGCGQAEGHRRVPAIGSYGVRDSGWRMVRL